VNQENAVLIDWHVHINDPKFIGKPWWPVPVPMTLDNALEAHALVGLDRTVISNAVHYIRHMNTDREIVAALESSNRYLAACRDKHRTSSCSWPPACLAAGICIGANSIAPSKATMRAR
jgi:hypothetical protein